MTLEEAITGETNKIFAEAVEKIIRGFFRAGFYYRTKNNRLKMSGEPMLRRRWLIREVAKQNRREAGCLEHRQKAIARP